MRLSEVARAEAGQRAFPGERPCSACEYETGDYKQEQPLDEEHAEALLVELLLKVAAEIASGPQPRPCPIAGPS